MAEALFKPQDDASWLAWAEEQLQPLDLSVGLLHDVVESGQRAEAASSPLGPLNGPGVDRWKETLVALRTRTGWPTSEDDGLSRTYHPSERFYIVVTTGRNGVGQFVRSNPTPKNGLGSVLQGLIDEPELQIPLITRAGLQVSASVLYDPKLWLLLTSFHNGQIFCELSQPATRNGDVVTSYARRIQIPPLAFNAESVETVEDFNESGEGGGDAPDIDIQPL